MMAATKELFDCELLIIEVEKRPALFDFRLLDYSNKHLKEKLWNEVAEAVYSDWNCLSSEDRNEKGKQHKNTMFIVQKHIRLYMLFTK